MFSTRNHYRGMSNTYSAASHIYGTTLALVFMAHKTITYLLTPWSRVHLEKLTGFQLVKKFPAFMEPEGSLLHSPHFIHKTIYM
jgi:hypothetical protein